MDALAVWCRRYLGAPPTAELFEAGYLSTVKGLRLADGREVVVKVRPRMSRLAGCAVVHRALWVAGFPCPEPLVGLQPLDGYAATAEALVPNVGEPPPDSELAALSAAALARLVGLAPDPGPVPSLAPSPSFAGWDPARLARVEDSAAFLDAYQHARGRRWTAQDYAACWAAGLWQRTFDAKTQSLDGDPEQILTRHEAGARLRLAGLDPGLA
jgi:hypothetical protein